MTSFPLAVDARSRCAEAGCSARPSFDVPRSPNRCRPHAKRKSTPRGTGDRHGMNAAVSDTESYVTVAPAMTAGTARLRRARARRSSAVRRADSSFCARTANGEHSHAHCMAPVAPSATAPPTSRSTAPVCAITIRPRRHRPAPDLPADARVLRPHDERHDRTCRRRGFAPDQLAFSAAYVTCVGRSSYALRSGSSSFARGLAWRRPGSMAGDSARQLVLAGDVRIELSGQRFLFDAASPSASAGRTASPTAVRQVARPPRESR